MFKRTETLRRLFRRPEEVNPLERAIADEVASIQRHDMLRRAFCKPDIPE